MADVHDIIARLRLADEDLANLHIKLKASEVKIKALWEAINHAKAEKAAVWDELNEYLDLKASGLF